MAEKVMVSEQYLQDVADSIRTKLNEEDTYKPSEFSSKIDEMNIAPKIEKGLIVKACDEDGFMTDAEIVGITSIPNYYFYNELNGGTTTRIINLKLPDNIISIGNNAFRFCSKLELTELPDTITSMGDYCFRACKKITLPKLPGNLTSLPMGAFWQCTNLVTNELPSGLTSMGAFCFQECPNITISELPEGLTSLPNYCFDGCKKITISEIPENVTTIGEYVFRNCELITKLDILSEVLTGITGYSPFYGCSNLTQIIFRKSTPPTLKYNNAFNSTPIASGTGYIYVPDESVEAYQTATNWSIHAAQIKPISELEVTG